MTMGTDAKLTVTTPGGRSWDFNLPPGPTTIGRGQDCDLMLEHPFVSRHHARIEADASRFVLLDLGSRNGVFVNGERIVSHHLLTEGDEIGITDVKIEFTLVSDGDSTPVWTAPTARARMESPLRIDYQAWEVVVDGERLSSRLSVQEFALLCFMNERAGTVCSRNELGDAIWGSGNYDYNMLHRLVHRLKAKVETDPARPRFIQTVPRVGYSLQFENRL